MLAKALRLSEDSEPGPGKSPIQDSGNMSLFDRGQPASFGLRSELEALLRGLLLSLQLGKGTIHHPKRSKRNRGWGVGL